jgi:hypothetical protein
VTNVDVGTLTPATPGYDGATRKDLLSGTDGLAPGATATLRFDVTFDPHGASGPFHNQASATATGTSDLSHDGTVPDPNGNGDAGESDENDPTPIDYAVRRVIGVAKEIGAVVPQGDGSYATTVTLRIRNLGNVPLQNLQVSDDLTAVFPSPATFSVHAIDVGSLSPSPSPYDGSAQPDLLAGSDTLAPGGTAVISFELSFDPAGQAGPFFNQAMASATGTSDLSHEGSDPDPDADGDADEDDASTITVPPPTPVIGVAKELVSVEPVSGSMLRARFRIRVVNLGGADLQDVQVVEDLSAAFPAPATYVLHAGPTVSGSLSAASGAFDGSTQTALLAAGQTLAAGASGMIELSVDVTPNAAPTPFSNQVLATARSAQNVPTSDLSNDGDESDPDHDVDPAGSGEDAPTSVPGISPASVHGVVYVDRDGDRALGPADLRLVLLCHKQ